MEAKAEKTALAEQRVQKKAARRAAFIQDVAGAVADEIQKRTEAASADEANYKRAQLLDQTARQAVLNAEYAAKNPIIATYCDAKGKTLSEAYPTGLVLAWGIEQGILSQGTRELPDTDTQFLLLAGCLTKQE